MAGERDQPVGARAWSVARSQHGVIARRQLLDLGFSAHAIDHRIAKGRLHPLRRGVYAVGRPKLTRYGRWTAAVLASGPGAVLSHASAAALWEVAQELAHAIEISVCARARRRRPGLTVHRRANLGPADITRKYGIPVTTPILTLIDLAARLDREQLESAINAADRLDLVDPEALRVALDASPRRPGVRLLRETLDRRTFTRTDSWLERRFLPIAHRAGLPPPLTNSG
jgi:hypothetical protein